MTRHELSVSWLQSNRTRWFTMMPSRVQTPWRVMRSPRLCHHRSGRMSCACCSRERGSWRPAGVASIPRKSTSKTKRWGRSFAGETRRDETRRVSLSTFLKFQWFGLKPHACASHPPITGDLHHQSQPEDAAAAGWTRAGQLPADIAAGQTLQFHT